MSAPATTSSTTPQTSRGAAAAFAGVAIVALLWIVFMFMVYNDPGVRDLGFGSPGIVWNYSWLIFVLLFGIMLAVRMRWVPAAESGAPAAASSGKGAVPGGAVIPSAGHTRPRVSAEDPASRPGAPPSTSVPRVQAEHLTGGWRRFRFPAERTGGLYVDTDIVVDAGPQFSDSNDAPRGRMILRVRDEVARVCVRCDLIEHCHSKVAALITIEDMRGNSDCVPGLKRIAAGKMSGAKRPPAAAAATLPPAQNVPSSDAA